MSTLRSTEQLPLRFPKDIRINGDQFQATADLIRQRIAELSREAEIYESLAIEAWVKAEIRKSS